MYDSCILLSNTKWKGYLLLFLRDSIAYTLKHSHPLGLKERERKSHHLKSSVYILLSIMKFSAEWVKKKINNVSYSKTT